MTTILAITTSVEALVLLKSVLGNECDIIVSPTIEEGFILLGHVQPELVLLEQPYSMETINKITAWAHQACIMALTGSNAWPEAIREIVKKHALLRKSQYAVTAHPGWGVDT